MIGTTQFPLASPFIWLSKLQRNSRELPLFFIASFQNILHLSNLRPLSVNDFIVLSFDFSIDKESTSTAYR